jgi:hypothetical protein
VRSESELVEEKERLTLLLHTVGSKIRGVVRCNADAEYDLQEYAMEASELKGRLRELRWLRGE